MQIMIRALIALLLIPSFVFASEVPFSVTERVGVARTSSHINYSIPIDKDDNVTAITSLQVVDHDTEFTVISRYGGTPSDTSKPIRMVLVDFQDSILASATNNYTLKTDGTSSSLGSNIATDNTTYITIDTGVATFKISTTTGNLFESVIVGPDTLVNSPATSGMVVNVDGTEYTSYNNDPTVEIYRNGYMSCVIIVSGDLEDSSGNKLVPPTPALDSVVPDSNVKYTFYYWFYKGKSFVKVDQTLKNDGRGWSWYNTHSVEHLYLNTWRTDLQFTGAASSKTAEYASYTDAYTTGTYSLAQTENNIDGFDDTTYDWAWDLTKGAVSVDTGTKYSGYVGIRDSDGNGVILADKWFWQNYPSSYEISDNVLTYKFLPTRAAGYTGFTQPDGYSIDGIADRYLDANVKYRMLGGMWKTHKTIYYFHTSGTDYDEVVAECQSPLIIQTSTEYAAKTNYFSWQVNTGIETTYTFPADESLQDCVDKWSLYAKSIWDTSTDGTYGKAFTTHRDNREVPLWRWTKDSDSSTSNTYPSWYGWTRFGGSPRSYNYGFNSQHYEFTYQAFEVWQRDGYWPAYQLFEEMVEHCADVLTLHDAGCSDAGSGYGDTNLHGSQRYAEDTLCDNYLDRSTAINDPFVGNAHVWTRGVFVYYMFTGDPRYAEIIESYVYHCGQAKDAGSTTGETRDLTRLIGPLINDWQVNGNSTSLDTAWYIWNRLEDDGVAIGTDKFALDCRIASDKLWIGYDAMGTPYLIRLYYALVEAGETTNAAALLDKLKKIAKWNKDMVIGAWANTAGTYNGDKTEYYKYTTTNALYLNSSAGGDMSLDLPYHWDTEFYNANYSLSWCDLYAFMYVQTEETDWLTMARTAFKDRFMYNLAGDQTEAPASPSWQTLGIPASISSGSWKFGMAIIQPLFYLRTELISRGSPLNGNSSFTLGGNSTITFK